MITDEVAKPSKAALSEVLRSADLLEFTAEEGVRVAGELQLSDAFPGPASASRAAPCCCSWALGPLAPALCDPCAPALPAEAGREGAGAQGRSATSWRWCSGCRSAWWWPSRPTTTRLTSPSPRSPPLPTVAPTRFPTVHNYPLNLAVSKVGPALMAGNSMVMKPPSAGAVTGLVGIAAVFDLAGCPPGLLNVVTGKGSEIGDYLTQHKHAQGVTFTGGNTGLRVAKGAAMIPLQMELGGKVRLGWTGRGAAPRGAAARRGASAAGGSEGVVVPRRTRRWCSKTRTSRRPRGRS